MCLAELVRGHGQMTMEKPTFFFFFYHMGKDHLLCYCNITQYLDPPERSFKNDVRVLWN